MTRPVTHYGRAMAAIDKAEEQIAVNPKLPFDVQIQISIAYSLLSIADSLDELRGEFAGISKGDDHVNIVEQK